MKRLHLYYKPRKHEYKTYNYYSLAYSYTGDNGKSRRHEVLSLGELTKKEAAEWKLRLKVFNDGTYNIAFLDEMKFIESKQYLDIALLSHVYDSLGIGDIFSSARTENRISTSDIVKVLTLNRCINPTAHYKVGDFVSDSYLPELMDIDADKCNKDKIFRELDNIYGNRKKLQKLFHELSLKHQDPDNIELYFFDGTTSYFEGSSCEIAESGKDKTTGYQNKVILICLLTDKKGFPIIWDVFSGRKKDTTEFRAIATDMAKEFGIKEITLCFDRGVASEPNFDFIEKKLDSKYITGLDKNQFNSVFNIEQFALITKDKLIKEHEESDDKNKSKKTKEKRKEEKKRIIPMNINGFYKFGKDRFYKELGVINNRRHVVSFNVSIYKASKETRLNNIEIVKNKIENLNNELKFAKKDRESKPTEEKIELSIRKYQLQGIINYEIIPIAVTYKQKKVQSYKITYSINEDEIIKKENEDGVLVYITNHIKCEKGIYEVTALDIVAHYKNKYIIENAFRHIKSFIDLRPFNVYLKEHVVAHIDICMIAYFMNTYIYQKLSKAGISLEKFYSLIKSHSRTCTMSTGTGEPASWLKVLSKEVRHVIKLLGASPVLSKQVLEKLNIIK
jgi:hypothetical protein